MNDIFRQLTKGIKFDKSRTKDVKNKLAGQKRTRDEAAKTEVPAEGKFIKFKCKFRRKEAS